MSAPHPPSPTPTLFVHVHICAHGSHRDLRAKQRRREHRQPDSKRGRPRHNGPDRTAKSSPVGDLSLYARCRVGNKTGKRGDFFFFYCSNRKRAAKIHPQFPFDFKLKRVVDCWREKSAGKRLVVCVWEGGRRGLVSIKATCR